MKLFIFKPSKYWDYCGGMVMATAPSYAEACHRLQAKENEKGDMAETLKFTQTDFAEKPKRHQGCPEINTWVLFRVVDVANNLDLCEIEYNYG